MTYTKINLDWWVRNKGPGRQGDHFEYLGLSAVDENIYGDLWTDPNKTRRIRGGPTDREWLRCRVTDSSIFCSENKSNKTHGGREEPILHQWQSNGSFGC